MKKKFFLNTKKNQSSMPSWKVKNVNRNEEERSGNDFSFVKNY